MNIFNRPITILPCALLLGACSSYQTPQTQAISEAIDFSRFDTFSVRVQGETYDTAFGPVWRERVFNQLVDEFEKIGYSFKDNTKADFYVVFSTVVKDQDSVFSTDYSQPEQYMIVKESNTIAPDGHIVATDLETEIVTTYKSTPISLESLHRLFVIDIVDTDTDVLLWRGYTKSEDIELAEVNRIDEHIERIVKELPRS